MKHTPETRRRISEAVKRAVAEGRCKVPRGWRHTEEMKATIGRRGREAADAAVLAADFNSLSLSRKRRRLVLEQRGACARCGLGEWLGQPIALELDHKAEYNGSEAREALWMICPNCHSQTANWRGRGQGRRPQSVSDADLLAALQAEPTIRAALLRVGLVAEGGSYRRARRLLENVIPSRP